MDTDPKFLYKISVGLLLPLVKESTSCSESATLVTNVVLQHKN